MDRPLDLYTGDRLPADLPAGEYALFLVDGVADVAGGQREAWVIQTVAALAAALPADEAGQLSAISAAALLRFGGPGATWRAGSRVELVGRVSWLGRRSGEGARTAPNA